MFLAGINYLPRHTLCSSWHELFIIIIHMFAIKSKEFFFFIIFTNTPVPWYINLHQVSYSCSPKSEFQTWSRVPDRIPRVYSTMCSPPKLSCKAHKELSHPWWCRIFFNYTRMPPLLYQSHNLREAKPTLDFQASYFRGPTLLMSITSLRALKTHTNYRVSYLANNSGRSDSRCAIPLRVDLQLRSTASI